MTGGIGMDIGDAIHALHNGRRVTRRAWVTRVGFPYLVLVPGSQITVDPNRPLGTAAPELVGKTVEYSTHIDLMTPDRTLTPWVPAHADLLADDWLTVD